MSLNKRTYTPVICMGFCLVLLVVLTYCWQRIFFFECHDWIISDIPIHLSEAAAGVGYGLAYAIPRVLWSFLDDSTALTALSVLLAGNMLLGIATLWLLVCSMFPSINKSYLLLSVIVAHICGPWIVPGYQTDIYLNAYNGNVFHNMTVLFSRTFIPLSFYFFFKIWEKRREKLALLPCLGFAISFCMSTLFKPNFAFAFIPMLAVWLIYDFIKFRAKNLKNEFLIGLTVVPAGLVCVFQFLMLFFGGVSDNDPSNPSGVALRMLLGTELLGFVVYYIRGGLLPIYSLSLQGRREKGIQDSLGIFIICNLVAILEALVLVETGPRALHGNFYWGACALYPTLFAVSIAMLMRMIQQADMKNKRDWLKIAVGVIFLIGHVAAGIACLARPFTLEYLWWKF